MAYISYDDLYDYQKDIISKLNSSKCIWLPPSTGKTLTSIWAYKLYGKGKLLIIAPASMISEWENTLEEMEITDYDIYSYNKLCYNKYITNIICTDYDTCIIDEHQHLNNYKNKSTKQILKKVDDIRLKYLLSATPSGNYEWKDLYIPFRIIYGKSFMSYAMYRRNYFIETPSRWNRYVYDIIGYKNVNDLNKYKNETSVIYNKEHKAQVIEEELFISAFNQIYTIKDYAKMLRTKVCKDYLIDSTAKSSYFKRMVASGILLRNDNDSYDYSIINTNRINVLNKLFDKHKDTQIVVFYNYKNEISMIEHELRKYNYDYTIFTNKEDLETKEPKHINFISYSVGSEGLNKFKDCTVYIAYSLPYSYIKWKQSKGRINRLDTYDKEYYYYLYNEIDKKVLDTIKKGKSFSDKLMEKATI